MSQHPQNPKNSSEEIGMFKGVLFVLEGVVLMVLTSFVAPKMDLLAAAVSFKLKF